MANCFFLKLFSGSSIKRGANSAELTLYLSILIILKESMPGTKNKHLMVSSLYTKAKYEDHIKYEPASKRTWNRKV